MMSKNQLGAKYSSYYRQSALETSKSPRGALSFYTIKTERNIQLWQYISGENKVLSSKEKYLSGSKCSSLYR